MLSSILGITTSITCQSIIPLLILGPVNSALNHTRQGCKPVTVHILLASLARLLSLRLLLISILSLDSLAIADLSAILPNPILRAPTLPSPLPLLLLLPILVVRDVPNLLPLLRAKESLIILLEDRLQLLHVLEAELTKLDFLLSDSLDDEVDDGMVASLGSDVLKRGIQRVGGIDVAGELGEVRVVEVAPVAVGLLLTLVGGVGEVGGDVADEG